MSGARRTEDFNAVKTRQLILVNPDGSFPVQGQLIGVTDSRGTLGPTPNPVFGTISATNINVANYPNYQDISAVTIQADTITTNTLDVTNNGRLTAYDICANRVETVYLTVTDICADCITVDTIYSRQIGSAANPVDVGNFIQVNSSDITSSVTIETPYLNVTSQLDAQDISVTNIDAERITTVELAVNEITRAEIINTIALDVGTADINDLTVTGVANIPTLVSTDITSTNIVATNATITGNLTTSGTFNPANITTAGTITAGRIVGLTDISSASIYAGVATFDTLNVTTANVDISGLNYPSLSANVITGGQINATGRLVVAGSAVLNDVSASSLFVSRGTILNTVTATQITAPTINATQRITLFDTAELPSVIPPNPGVLTYDVSDGLLLNGLLVSTSAAFGRTQPFSLVTATNNLATVTDVSATLLDLLNSYNAFLTLFSNAKLMIQLTPVVNFLSPYSIQFVINNVAQPPLILSGKYSLGATNVGATTLMTILTQAALNYIRFTSTPDTNNDWRVTIDVSGSNNFISDVSGMPTGSLQVLRTLGFPINISSNPYETYALNGPQTEYILTPVPLAAGYSATGAILPQLVQYTNNLAVPIYTLSGNIYPYSLPIVFTNLVGSSTAQYLAINYNNVYTLYPNTISLVTFSGLTPNTSYPFTFNYLDMSNNSFVSPLLTTTKIPAPSNITSTGVSFNMFTLNWSQPFPGKVYTFTLDASGQYITTPITGASSPITYFPLVQNTTYSVTITSNDPDFPTKPSDPSLPITVTTNALIVPTPVISTIPNTNVAVRASWGTPVPVGAGGTFDYNVNSGPRQVYTLSGTDISFNITDLSGVGDISCSLVYTDNYYNTIRGGQATYRYDTSFGFYDMSAIPISAAITLNNTTLNGIGYVFPNILKSPAPAIQNPWIGYKFNRILFSQGIREITGNAVAFRANIYNVNPTAIGGLYISPYTVSPFDISSGVIPSPPPYSPDISSNTVILDASATPYLRYPTLTFTTPVIISQYTMLLFEIVSGSGTIQFATYQFSSAIAKNAYATSIAYNRPLGIGTLSNWSVNVLNSVICQLSYV